MNRENEISAELKEMGSPLADMPRTMPFTVPDGYFTGFGAALAEARRLLTVPDPALNESKSMPFSVPPGYFGNLTNNIINNTKSSRHRNDDIKSMPLTVPSGYFEQLPGQILNKVKVEKNKAPVQLIALRKQPLYKKVQWAIAAMFVLFIGIGAYWIQRLYL